MGNAARRLVRKKGEFHDYPVVVHHYTPTRGRDGLAKFLEGYKGYLQADAYCVYDAFFKPARGLTKVGCMMHMRRDFYKVLDSDQERMGKPLHLIARLYWSEERANRLGAPQSAPIATLPKRSTATGRFSVAIKAARPQPC